MSDDKKQENHTTIGTWMIYFLLMWTMPNQCMMKEHHKELIQEIRKLQKPTP